MDIHTFPTKEEGQQLLAGVPPDLIQGTLKTELKFNPNYYRIWTSAEISAAENDAIEDNSPYPMEEESPSLGPRQSDARGSSFRKQSQIMVNFPATLEEINQDLHLLGNMNDIKEESSTDSDQGDKKSKYAPSNTTGAQSK